MDLPVRGYSLCGVMWNRTLRVFSQRHTNGLVLCFPSDANAALASSSSSSSSSWSSLGLEDDIICASYLWVREWLCRPILDLQSRAQSGHWKFAFVTGIEAAKWRRSLANCAWWRRSSSRADDADCVRTCQLTQLVLGQLACS